MKHFYYSIFFILSGLLLVVSCKKESDSFTGDYGYNYFPEDSGSYVIYKIDSFLFDDFNQTRRIRTLYLKQEITEVSLDNLGRLAKKVELSYSDTLTSNWEVFKVDYIVKTNKVVERWEDNLRYVKLVFPTEKEVSWLGNKYIITPPPYILDSSNYRVTDWQYTIQKTDERYDNSFQVYDSTLTVFHIYDSSAINKTYSLEKYARNVGLVYKEFWIVTGQTNIGAPWFDRAEKGFIMFQYAIDYGPK